MNGMEMLLQSFGVDTDEVKNNIQSAVELVRVMNEQLAAMNLRLDSVDAKLCEQSDSIRMVQSKAVDIDATLLLIQDKMRTEEWPPHVTQSYDELQHKLKESLQHARGADNT